MSGGGGPGVAIPKRVTSLAQIISNTSRKGVSTNGDSASRCPILQVAASHSCTLLLCRSRAAKDMHRLNVAVTQQVNEVYQWGHGHHQPSRVSFNPTRESKPRSGSNGNLAVTASDGSWVGGSARTSASEQASLDRFFGADKHVEHRMVNIVQLAAGRFHNVAISTVGHVYTWCVLRYECIPGVYCDMSVFLVCTAI